MPAKGMANKHTKPQCEFIVRKLAAFEPPRAIAIDFCAVFPDTKCDENDVRRLDPDSGAIVSPELFTLFKTTRETVLLSPSSAPYAEQQARLIALSADVRFYRGNNQLPEARAVLRQIAEELGVMGAGKKKDGGGGKNEGGAPAIVGITRTVVDPAAAVSA